MKSRESDLYLPVKQFLEAQGYDVKGEVKECDVLAVRAQETPLVVELKLSLNLNVILQAVQRLSLSSYVYVAVPRQCKTLASQKKRIIKLLKMLGLGLITIDLDSDAVKVMLDPGAYTPRVSRYRQTRLLGEFAKRIGDPNLGGSESRSGIVTAYRQSAVTIAEYLLSNGPTKASHIAKSLNEAKARNILYKNVYGWFENTARGIYQLSPRGQCEWTLWTIPPNNTNLSRKAETA